MNSLRIKKLAKQGRYGDTELAHVNPQEKALLKALGGSGTTNPKTGLKEYHWYHSHSSPIKISTPKITIPKSTGDIGIISDIADATGYTGSDLDTVGQQIEGAVTDTAEAVGEAVSGTYESGEFNPSFYMDDPMGFGGGFFSDFDYTWDDFVDDVSDSTPDIKITDTSTGDIADQISDATPDIKITDTSTGDIVDQVDQLYQGSDIDTTLEGLQEIGELMVDAAEYAITGEEPDSITETKEDLAEVQTDYQDLADNIVETGENIGDIATDTITTGNQVMTEIGENAAEQVMLATGRTPKSQSMLEGEGLEAAEGDEVGKGLRIGRRGARKGSKASEKRGGGVALKGKGSGLNIPKY